MLLLPKLANRPAGTPQCAATSSLRIVSYHSWLRSWYVQYHSRRGQYHLAELDMLCHALHVSSGRSRAACIRMIPVLESDQGPDPFPSRLDIQTNVSTRAVITDLEVSSLLFRPH